MSRKGQALIEALAGLSLSALLFVSCLKIWMIAVTDFKKEIQERETEVCSMTGSAKCTPDAGFVLVTMLMYLSVLVFSSFILIAMFLTEEFRWKISSWCFENGIVTVSGNLPAPATELATIEREMNKTAPQVVQFRATFEGPVRTESPDSGLTESYYKIQWATTNILGQKFFKIDDFTNQLKCGARKLCHDEKCIYSVIADKS